MSQLIADRIQNWSGGTPQMPFDPSGTSFTATTVEGIIDEVADVVDQLKPLINVPASRTYQSVADLLADTSAKTDGLVVEVASLYSGYLSGNYGAQGGGKFVWSSTVAKSRHNGAVIISSTVPWDGTRSTVLSWQNKVGETSVGGSGCWLRIFDGYAVSSSWWGTVANDLSFDVAPLLGKMWSFVVASRKSPIANISYVSVKAEVPPGEYSINSSVNFTNCLTWNIHLNLEGAIFIAGAGCAGKAMFDATNVRGLHIKGGYINSLLASVQTPLCGLLVGPKGTDTCGNNRFDDLKIMGQFSYAPYINIGSETSYHFNCYFANTSLLTPTYGAAFDGMHSDTRVVSDYTVLRANNVAVSFTNNRFYGCHFRHYGQGGVGSGSTIYSRSSVGWEFDKGCYYLTFDKSAFEIYNDPTYRTTNLKIDGSFETNQNAGMTDVLTMIVPDGANSAIAGFHFSTQTPLASNSLIKMVNESGGVTTGSLKLTNAYIQSLELMSTATMFSQCNNLSIIGYIGTRSSSQLNIKDIASMKGDVYVADKSVMNLTGVANKAMSIRFIDEGPVNGSIQYNNSNGTNFEATGSSTDVSMFFKPKGGGVVAVNSLQYDSAGFNGWLTVSSLTAGVLDVTNRSLVQLSLPANSVVTSITDSFNQTVPILTIRNTSSSPVTFVSSTGSLRLNNGVSKLIAAYETISFVKVASGIWQETAGATRINLSSIVDLVGLTPIKDGATVDVASFYSGWAVTAAGASGGGKFVWVAGAAKSLHDGIEYISPTVPWDGTSANLAAWQAKTGETAVGGTGCWRRIVKFERQQGPIYYVDDPAFGIKSYKEDPTFDAGPGIQALLTKIRLAGGGTLKFPANKLYRKAKTSGNLYYGSNTSIIGEGMYSGIYFDDPDTSARVDLFATYNSTAINEDAVTYNVEFNNFAVWGTVRTYRNETNRSQCFTGKNIIGLKFKNMFIDGVRFMATAFNNCKGVEAEFNTLNNCLRDGLRFTNSEGFVSFNKLYKVSDDCIVAHVGNPSNTDLPTTCRFVVSNNLMVECQTIACIGSRNMVVSDNVSIRPIRGFARFIQSGYASYNENSAAIFNNLIHGNVIVDPIMDMGSNFLINVDTPTLTSTDGLSNPPFDLMNTDYMATQAEQVRALGITIRDNSLRRSLVSGQTYSAYNFDMPTFLDSATATMLGITYTPYSTYANLLFDRTLTGLYQDKSFTETTFSGHPVQILGSVYGLVIESNDFSDFGFSASGVSFNAQSVADTNTMYVRGRISKNIFRNGGVGVSFSTLSNGHRFDIEVEDNEFDLDPYLLHSSHASDNTWTSTGSIVGINLGSTANPAGIKCGGNHFKNMGRTGLEYTDVIQITRPNFVYSDFVGPNDTTTNKGVRYLPSAASNIIIPIDGDPTSVSYQTHRNTVRISSSSIPTTGYYCSGHFVKNSSIAAQGTAGAQTYVLGWHRATTGNVHVAGTDWLPIEVPTVERSAMIGGTWVGVTSITAGVLDVGSNGTIGLSIASDTTVTDITDSFTTGVPVVTMRNLNTGAITFTYNSSKIRTLNLGDVTVNTNESIAFAKVTTGVWQQVSGKQSTIYQKSNGIGYGTGSGGTVTQATSKSTGVTLNKPSGKITMNAAALAANAVASFVVTNSTVSSTDTISLSFDSSGPISQELNYRLISSVGTGQFTVAIQNISAGSLSEAVTIRYNVHKGSNS